MNKDVLANVLPIAVLIAAVLVGKTFDVVSWQDTLGAGLIVFVVLTMIVVVTAKLSNSGRSAELDVLVSKLTNLVHNGYPKWLLTSEALQPVEANAATRSIWIASPNLSNDTFLSEDHALPNIIRENAKRGVTYTYFIPRTLELASAVAALHEVFRDAPRNLKVVEVPEQDWERSFLAHAMVLNPDSVGGFRPQAFLELPLEERGGGKSHWIRVAADVEPKITGRLRAFLAA